MLEECWSMGVGFPVLQGLSSLLYISFHFHGQLGFNIYSSLYGTDAQHRS